MDVHCTGRTGETNVKASEFLMNFTQKKEKILNAWWKRRNRSISPTRDPDRRETEERETEKRKRKIGNRNAIGKNGNGKLANLPVTALLSSGGAGVKCEVRGGKMRGTGARYQSEAMGNLRGWNVRGAADNWRSRRRCRM